MNQILYSERSGSESNKKIIILLIALVVVIVSAIFVISSMLNRKILANVYIGDVNVGMQTQEKARELLESEFETYKSMKIKLILNGKEEIYTADELGINVDSMLDDTISNAYQYGRSGNFFENSSSVVKSYFNDNKIGINIAFDDEKLKASLSKLAGESGETATDDTYEIQDDKIVIVKGHDGNKVDFELAKQYIATAVINGVVNVNVPIVDGNASRIDLKKLYDDTYVVPQNASYTSGEKFELVVDKNGKSFDLSEAQLAYNNAKAGEEVTIKFKEIEAEIKVADLDIALFKNVLSTFSSTYDQSVTGRVTNLKVAAERCNNTILYPGEEFSYNKALGTRTVANGFAPGHSFAGGKVVTTIGGGICQVSSALYNVVLEADLEVTNRVAHGLYVEYVKPSLDATVVDGAIDFKFKNNRKYPVKIGATVENGVVTVTLYGIKDENEPIIEIESVVLETIPYKTVNENDSSMKVGTSKVVQDPVNGYVSEAYRIEKDSSGNVISRTLISKDRYAATNKIIKIGTKVEATPTPAPTPTPTPDYSDDDGRELPPGWDSPESPYGRP